MKKILGIRFYKCNIDNILWKFRLLHTINQSIEVKTFSGSGKGKIVNSLDEMNHILIEIQKSLHILLENTEKFLLVYSGQMQEADHYAANSFKKGEMYD